MHAQHEAFALRHPFIGTEHILLGLLMEAEGVAAIALDRFGLTTESVRDQVRQTVGPSSERVKEKAPFTPRAKKVLELALREALRLGHNYIGTEHLLLGLVREGEGVAAQILSKVDATQDAVRFAVIELLTGQGVAVHQEGDALSGPQRQVLELLAAGRSHEEVAGALDISEATVKNHVHDVLEKLSPTRRAGAPGAVSSPSAAGGSPPWVDRLSPAVRQAIETTDRLLSDPKLDPERRQLITSGQLLLLWLGEEGSHVRKVFDSLGIDRDAVNAAVIDTPTDGTSDESPGARKVEIELPDSATAAAARQLSGEELAEAIRRYVDERPPDLPPS